MSSPKFEVPRSGVRTGRRPWASNALLTRVRLLLTYPAFRALGFPRALPINLTVSVTYACPSRCRTCNIWKKRARNLSVEEYRRVFESLGDAVQWATLSGGDQFLRADLPEIARAVREILRPSVINIPMNGILTHRIEELLPDIAKATKGSQLILNFSLDDLGGRHDDLRGHRKNFEKVEAMFRFAKGLQCTHSHMVIGIHTVVSRHNVDRLPEIAEALKRWQPDSYITEVAEERVELGTVGESISPDPDAYDRAAKFLMRQIRQGRSRHPVGRLVESFRLEYYDLARRVLRERVQVIPCYGGWASAQLAPDGEVWGCCVRAESFGNVRDYGLNFGRVWASAAADRFRDSVRACECACPLANAAYTNLLLSPRSLLRVASNFVSPGRE